MPRNGLAFRVTALGVAALLLTTVTADAQRRRRAAAKPTLSEETLVPSEFLSEAEAKRFAYPDGVEIGYFAAEGEHRWVLVERPYVSPTATPTPAPAVSPSDGTGAAPAAPDIIDAKLEPTTDEIDFLREVGLIRPTVVTLRFAESAQAAQAMVDAFMTAKGDETQRPHEYLVTFKLEKAPNVSGGAVIYNREFNLGEKTGGWRRASKIMLAKGNVVVGIDARRGLRDGEFDSRFDNIEKRARDVARYLLAKL